MKKKILFVATRKFWPYNSGKEYTLYYNCKGLAEIYGYEIYLFCFTDKETDVTSVVPDFIKEIRYVQVPGIKKSIGTVLGKTLGKEKWPIQLSLYYNREIEEKLYQYYSAVQPDVLIIDMIRLVPYIERFEKKQLRRILIADDLLEKRYKRQMESGNSGGSVVGYFSHNLPPFLNKLIDSSIMRNLILKFERKRILSYEKRLVDKFDFITFISEIETKEFNSMCCTNKGITLTLGADMEYCAEDIFITRHEDALSIVGNFYYPPNYDSIINICENILPLIKRNVTLEVVGKYPPELAGRYASDKVHFWGYVDDVREIVESTAIFLAPIAYGTGIKTKIVEAMAMGMPVITNSFGAEGLSAVAGKDLIVCDDNRQIAELVDMLLVNPKKREELGDSAQKYALKWHSWEKVYDAFGRMGL